MTNFEYKKKATQLLTKYANQGQRRTHVEHGHSQHFGDGSNRTMKLSDTSGWVPRENDPDSDPDAWRDDITSAINYIQQAIAKTVNDDGLNDALATLLSTADVLSRVPNGSLIRKAKVNPTGQTQSPVVVASNTQARTPGSKPIVISSAELAQWAQESPALMRLAQKYPHLFAEENP